jgi:hypothetical protein
MKMAESDGKTPKIPDLAKLEEHGISIDAPTPAHFVMPDPWAPRPNGQGIAVQQPAESPGSSSPEDD